MVPFPETGARMPANLMRASAWVTAESAICRTRAASPWAFCVMLLARVMFKLTAEIAIRPMLNKSTRMTMAPLWRFCFMQFS